MILGKTREQWLEAIPLLKPLTEAAPFWWLNPNRISTARALPDLPLQMADVMAASRRLDRFAPYLAQVFPELKVSEGIIESPLRAIPRMQREGETFFKTSLPGQLWLKLDSHLPVSGSIKARGGIYEVLAHAETLALHGGLLHPDDDYRVLDTPPARAFFSQHCIEVGSTGNLGLSIGLMGARMGFRVTVHMSQDAREWKKDLLRERGVTVREYASDYSLAVASGRRESALNPVSYFVDDENSQSLFLGYTVAALRLQQQFQEVGITVNAEHPLMVYLPCGVGGGPGGVAFGLKMVFGDHVHCFFAEPTHSPAVLLGLLTEAHDAVCVQDFGLDNRTAADGLAVGRPSGLVCTMMKPLLTGAYTVPDEMLFQLLGLLNETEELQLEPSALAGMPGPFQLMGLPETTQWLTEQGLQEKMHQAAHLVWATGGSMVPASEMAGYLAKAAETSPATSATSPTSFKRTPNIKDH